jgi:hypothetical protein
MSDSAPATAPGWDPGDEQARSEAAAQPRQRERERGPLARHACDVHVVPEPRTATWRVYLDADTEAVSEHTSETEAESAARAQLRTRDTSTIVIHDRYHRTRAAAP